MPTSDAQFSPAPLSLSGYVIRLNCRYVKWHVVADTTHWTYVDDPLRASRFAKSMDAMDCRPRIMDEPEGLVVLLRSCVDRRGVR